MRCADFHRQLPSLLDGSVDGATRRELGLHMVECPECAALAESDDFWTDTVSRALNHKAPADLRAAILADDPAAAHPGGRRGLWTDIARYVWRDLTWRTWVEVLAVTAVVMVAVTWYTGRDATPPPFGRSGPVTMISAPGADRQVDSTGTLYLTDRLY
ncbi:MAG: hypothetical protein GY838_14595 [bacterium]|nr:hypothetical protein [bacterium]